MKGKKKKSITCQNTKLMVYWRNLTLNLIIVFTLQSVIGWKVTEVNKVKSLITLMVKSLVSYQTAVDNYQCAIKNNWAWKLNQNCLRNKTKKR